MLLEHVMAIGSIVHGAWVVFHIAFVAADIIQFAYRFLASPVNPKIKRGARIVIEAGSSAV
jgi:hypothetical protein